MHVCAVSIYPPTVAGVAGWGAHLIDHLARDGRVERITVLANHDPRAPAQERRGKVEVRRLWRVGSTAIAAELLRSICELRPEVVWFNLGLTMFGTDYPALASGLATPALARLLGYRSVVTLHELPALADLDGLGFGSPLGHAAGDLATRLVLGADAVTVTLERYRRFLVGRYGARNVAHVPLGAWCQPRELPPLTGERALVFGTFGPHKDPGLVADAVQRLRRIRPRLGLTVAGADHPRYPGFTARWRAAWPDRHALEWRGFVPEDGIEALFQRASVVVVPARSATGSSGVIHRALGYGRPVLASSLGDYQALAAEEGLELAWFEPGSVASLASALDALLDQPERRAAMVRRNLAAMERLAPSAVVGALLSVFAPPDAVGRHAPVAPWPEQPGRLA